MFGKVASDVLGLSDIGTVIKPQDYDKADSDDYIMHEDGEKIYFLIKSKSDEYCFTNKALIHLDGTSAASKKRVLRRLDYYKYHLSNVLLETAGTVDLDVEIKFKIGSEIYSIDVHKKHLTEVKDLYKSLIKIGEITTDNSIYSGFANESLQLASSTLGQVKTDGVNVVEQFKEVNQYAFNWLSDKKKELTLKDFGFVFEKFIQN
ncbi:PH domain-containing protein [Rossellomorea vietnamensis]|jgi:Bacterial PH domain/YvbH-like oligomerisation region|uniref:PH domain-containing protein n=1 Tax=Rossellomorea vietnamensis TaxID=218284 RepID=A0ACD4C889_9BACI|nr:PH domain-containing protein [Rossellomorea vietnamensis]UXH44823.1 PH domain-containing protein [Rossellomorea vietnamensis]WQI96180.1 PH domain-containing protein [Rossellomorea vietnamensis]